METWYRIHFIQEQVGRGAGKDLIRQFVASQRKANFPEGFALFEMKKPDVFDLLETSDEIDLSETYLLPPSAALHSPQLLRRYNAEPCAKPALSAVKVSVCEESDLTLYFG